MRDFPFPSQEDYGWGVWASQGKDRFWVALSYVGDGPREERAEWVITVASGGLLSRLLRNAHSQRAGEQLRKTIWDLLKSQSGIQVVELPRYS